MRIRATTLQDSPFAIDTERINRRVLLLASALRRAYLAYCSETERQSIIALLRNSQRPVDRPAGDPGYMAALVRGVLRTGYAVTPPVANDPIAGLAVPVSRGSRVFACLTPRYPGRAMTEAEAVKRYLLPLQQAARAIAGADGLGDGKKADDRPVQNDRPRPSRRPTPLVSPDNGYGYFYAALAATSDCRCRWRISRFFAASSWIDARFPKKQLSAYLEGLGRQSLTAADLFRI
jgi:hypothetical protein